MKIFALFSSPKGECSKGYALTKKLINEIEKNGGNVSKINCYHANNLNILPSNGDESIFTKGVDPLDSMDNFNLIKSEIEDSDLIILGSPVYAQNVSAHMKIFMERISHYAHDFRLIGKLSYVITTSYSNGNDKVRDYIQSSLAYMGIVNVGNVDLLGRFQTVQNFDSILSKDALKIIELIEHREKITFDANHEKIFSDMKELYKKFGFEKRYIEEYNSYQKRGLFEKETFHEAFLDNFNKERK